jgi:hypothetical protein
MRAEYIQGAPISALERCLHAKNDEFVLVNHFSLAALICH